MQESTKSTFILNTPTGDAPGESGIFIGEGGGGWNLRLKTRQFEPYVIIEECQGQRTVRSLDQDQRSIIVHGSVRIYPTCMFTCVSIVSIHIV